MEHSSSKGLRRYEDRPIGKWKQWAATAIIAGAFFVAGLLVHDYTAEKIQAVVTSFAGGVLAVVVVWGGLGRQIFENLEKVAESRGERIGELERDIKEERENRVQAIRAQEERHDKAIKEQEERHSREIQNLKKEIENWKLQSSTLEERNRALQDALTEAMKHRVVVESHSS